MSAFVLKIIAIITMSFDHVGYLIFGRFSFFNYIGRIAFPIFAFQISQGYTHTKNLKRYLSRLFIFALISQIPFMLFFSTATNNIVPVSQIPSFLYTSFTTFDFNLNIFFTLFIGLISILAFDKIKYKFVGLSVGIGLATLAEYLHMDYGFYGVAIILLFYIFNDHKVARTCSFILATVINFAIPTYNLYTTYYSQGIDISDLVSRNILRCAYTILPIMIISLYNSEKGKNIKYLLYLFYPIHLLLIYVISTFIR